MEAPFTRTGPGQSVRLVYQVLGANGPIPNPNRIRYIPVEPGVADGPGLPSPTRFLPSQPADASAVMGALQLANLGITVVNLAISAATLIEVRKHTRLLREMQAGLHEIRADIKTLLDRTERIDVNVAEVNLRATLQFALTSAAKGHEVDLVLLGQLVGRALDRFCESLGGPIVPGTKRDLTLSPDVREMAEAALHLLWSARLTAIEAHNLSCSGDAMKVVRDDDVRQRLQRLAGTATLVAATGASSQVADDVAAALRGNRLFIGSSGGVRKYVQDKMAELDRALDEVDPVRPARSLLSELQDEKELRRAREEGPQETTRVLDDYLAAWTAHTDAGLLWRLRIEVDLQDDDAYWRGLEGWLTPPTSTAEEPGVTRVVTEATA